MLTNYVANLIIDNIIGRNSGMNVGPDIYVGLSTTTPAVDGTNVTEPSGNGYARVLIGYYGQSATLKMSAASAGASSNAEEIHFPKATGAWGSCTYAVFYDAATGGNLLFFSQLVDDLGDPAPISPVLNNVAIIEVGKLDISITA